MSPSALPHHDGSSLDAVGLEPSVLDDPAALDRRSHLLLGTISFAMITRMALTPTTQTMPTTIAFAPSITTLLPASLAAGAAQARRETPALRGALP